MFCRVWRIASSYIKKDKQFAVLYSGRSVFFRGQNQLDRVAVKFEAV